MFKVNNGNTRARCEICSKLTINTPDLPYFKPCTSVSIVNFEKVNTGWRSILYPHLQWYTFSYYHFYIHHFIINFSESLFSMMLEESRLTAFSIFSYNWKKYNYKLFLPNNFWSTNSQRYPFLIFRSSFTISNSDAWIWDN